MAALIRIKGQFNIHNIFTTCSLEKVKIHRPDGLKLEYIKYNTFAFINWNQFCDEIDQSLVPIYQSKLHMKLFGFIPLVGLIGDFLFVLIYTAVSKSRFLISLNVPSFIAYAVAINCTIFVIYLEYRMKMKCAKAWAEVRTICNRYTGNVTQHRLKSSSGCCKSTTYYLEVHTPRDREFRRDRLQDPLESMYAIPDKDDDEENLHHQINEDDDPKIFLEVLYKDEEVQLNPDTFESVTADEQDTFEINPKTTPLSINNIIGIEELPSSVQQGPMKSKSQTNTVFTVNIDDNAGISLSNGFVPVHVPRPLPNTMAAVPLDKHNNDNADIYLSDGLLPVHLSTPLSTTMVAVPLDQQEGKVSRENGNADTTSSDGILPYFMPAPLPNTMTAAPLDQHRGNVSRKNDNADITASSNGFLPVDVPTPLPNIMVTVPLDQQEDSVSWKTIADSYHQE